MILINTLAYVKASNILSDCTMQTISDSCDVTFGGAPHTFISRDMALNYVATDAELITNGQRRWDRDYEEEMLRSLPDDTFIDLET